MKILEKIKKIFLVIGVFGVTLPTKVWALTDYDLKPEPAYGVYEPRSSRILDIGKIISKIIIPLILIIGIIIYSKKSQSSKLRKIITILLAMAIAVLLCFGVDKIIELYLEL